MYTNFNFSPTLRKGMAFLLLPLLAVMSISLANTAPPANNSVEITFPNLVHLSDHSLAREGEVLALGTQCADAISFTELNQLNQVTISWMQSTLHLYNTFGNTPIEELVGQINGNITNQNLDCIVSPNYLTYLSGHSMWGSPHDGYGVNAPVSDISEQLTAVNLDPLPNGGSGITVAMFDTSCFSSFGTQILGSSFGGVDYQADHSEYIEAQSDGPTEIPNLCGHGEGVASMLRTIAPRAKIQLYRVLGDNGFGTLDGLLNAIIDRPSSPNHVMNLSLGVMGNSPVLESILQEVNGQGTVIIAAAGNFGPDHTTQYPAAYPFVMAVAASNSDGEPTSYANPGDVLALGGDGDCYSGSNECLAVLNSQAGTGAAYWKGSSFSAGIVSGLAALLLQADNANEMLGPDEIRSIIEQGTDANGVISVNDTLHIYDGMYP